MAYSACVEPGCGSNARKAGLCHAHYFRRRNELPIRPERRGDVERFKALHRAGELAAWCARFLERREAEGRARAGALFADYAVHHCDVAEVPAERASRREVVARVAGAQAA